MTCVGKDVETSDPSLLVAMRNGAGAVEESLVVAQQVKHRIKI